MVNVLLIGLGLLHPRWAALFLTTFFMSLMFPTIFALGLKRLGPNTKIGGSLIVMAIVGGAVLTPIMGLMPRRTTALLQLIWCRSGRILSSRDMPLLGRRRDIPQKGSNTAEARRRTQRLFKFNGFEGPHVLTNTILYRFCSQICWCQRSLVGAYRSLFLDVWAERNFSNCAHRF